MSGTLTASTVKPGVRRSKKYTSGRVCISYPRVRGHLPREQEPQI